jgi:hypothetical protein
MDDIIEDVLLENEDSSYELETVIIEYEDLRRKMLVTNNSMSEIEKNIAERSFDPQKEFFGFKINFKKYIREKYGFGTQITDFFIKK